MILLGKFLLLLEILITNKAYIKAQIILQVIISENKFNSPDGLKFDRDGRLWMQTDGSYSNKDEYEGIGNNCMLAANPKTGEMFFNRAYCL